MSARLTCALVSPTADGRTITLITLSNANGTEVRVMSHGGIILSIRTRDREGQLGDVVLGYDTPAGYLPNPTYFGAVVGRYANRIAKGAFTLDGRTYHLATNNGANHLHGGLVGWNQAPWTADPFEDPDGVGVTLTHTSPDGDEGYPGTIQVSVTYRLTDDSAIIVDYEATTDQPTVINPTQHTYFNLSAGHAANVLEHELTVNADRFTAVDDGLIPTGELAPVAGTPFDFRTPTKIGARIDQAHPQLVLAGGYDHNYVLNRQPSDSPSLAALVVDPRSGRTLEVSTTQPGMQLYTGNHLGGDLTGKGGVRYGRRAGLCLETQAFPDSPNRPSFPSTVLRPGGTFTSRTIWRFGILGKTN